MLKIKEDSKYFHDCSNGCEIQDIENKLICITHENVEVCRCGWQIGWHNGVSAKILANR
ncbi:hypothetical protein ISS03_03920 [Patescibacteria group bacterium]|nr:hypothetical protein [Patescibacteria group bacterium]